MRHKRTSFLIGSLLSSLTVVVLMGQWLGKKPPAEPEKVKTDLILVAPENLAEGAIISIPKMSWKEEPTTAIKPGTITKKDNSLLSQVDGSVVRTPILKGEPIIVEKLIKTRGKSAISAVIREGMRAVTVPYSKLANAPSLIAPGDVVDVIIPKKADGESESYIGQTILTGIRVLAVNSELQKVEEQDTSKGLNNKAITLEVTASQAEDLAGAIRDGAVVISMQSIFATSRPAVPTSETKRSTPETKVITILRGPEKKDVTFNKVGK